MAPRMFLAMWQMEIQQKLYMSYEEPNLNWKHPLPTYNANIVVVHHCIRYCSTRHTLTSDNYNVTKKNNDDSIENIL